MLNLSVLLEQLADESYGMLSEKNMTCAVDAEEKLMFCGDPDKLARVFDNLLRNAAAYGYEGTQILIQARGGNGRITIVFTNEGPQIPQKKLEMIFEKFYRGGRRPFQQDRRGGTWACDSKNRSWNSTAGRYLPPATAAIHGLL